MPASICYGGQNRPDRGKQTKRTSRGIFKDIFKKFF